MDNNTELKTFALQQAISLAINRNNSAQEVAADAAILYQFLAEVR